MTKTLVIWDWDGTLVDSEPTAWAALTDTVTHYHKPPVTKENIINVMGNHMGRYWTDTYGADYKQAYLYFEKRFEYHNSKKELVLFPGSKDCLDYLKSKGIAQMVISNKVDWMLQEECHRLNLDSYFIRLVGTDTNSDDKKPNISFGKKALKGLNYEHLVMIGDGESDMNFALNIGAMALYVPMQQIQGVPYDRLFAAHNEILPVLKELFE